jgi:hypothetical protein
LGDQISRLALNFVQYCEISGPPLFGEIRFNSAIPLSTQVTGVDQSPDAFALIGKQLADANTAISFVPTTVLGINAATPISISGGEYSVNNGAYLSTASTVLNGDQIRVRGRTSSLPGVSSIVTLTIGDKSASQTVRSYLPGEVLTGLRASSTPGDYILGGIQKMYLAPMDRITSSSNFSNGVSIGISSLDGDGFTLDLASGTGAALAVGSYEDARRFPFNDSSPGLSFSGNGRGCNQVGGRFVVREIEFNNDGSLRKFAVDFDHRCELNGPPLFGELRINSSIPFTSIPAEIGIGVSVVKLGKGTGSVTALGGEFACGPRCLTYLPRGWNLSLEAQPTSGSRFIGWENTSFSECSGQTCAFQLNSPRIVQARFIAPTALTVEKTGTGTGSVSGPNISCGGTCTFEYDKDTVVTLSAFPSFGSVFAGWNGICSGSGTCTVTLDQAKTVQASFTAGFMLNVSRDQVFGSGTVSSSTGAINCGATCQALLQRDAVIALTATPNAGSRFVGWTGACTGTGPCNITINNTTNVTAIFGAATYSLSVVKTGTGSGTVSASNGVISCGASCSTPFTPQLGVSLNAVADADSVFMGWRGGNCSGTGLCVVSQQADTAITAVFVKGRLSTMPRTDLSADGRADLLMSNVNGGTYALLMNGTTGVTGGYVVTNNMWSVAATADFNGDGKTDIALRNNSDGSVYIVLMNGATVLRGAFVSTGNTWSVAGTGDFNGDGKADLVLRQSDGSLYALMMDGTTVLSGGYITTGNTWNLAATTDLNGDGRSDIILRQSNGSLYSMLMNGSTVQSGAYLTTGNTWTLAGTADINGDGKGDVILRQTDGSLYLLIMDGTSVSSGAYLTTGDSWGLVAMPDLDGDGKRDIMLRQSDGSLYMLLMNGTAVTSGAYLTTGNAWTLRTTGDYNGDARTDIVIQNADGSSYMLLMNGTVVVSGAYLLGPGSPWVVLP